MMLRATTAPPGFSAPTLLLGTPRPSTSLSSAIGPRRRPISTPLPYARKYSRLQILQTCVGCTPPPASQRRDDLPPGGRIRQGVASDALTMSKLILSAGMNPRLGDISLFLVYETADGDVVGGGQVRPGNPGELASLVVAPSWRNRGVGTAIARALVEREENSRSLCLLCLTRAFDFYSNLGFSLCEHADELPKRMQIEKKIGSVLAAIVAPGNKVLGMVRGKKV